MLYNDAIPVLEMPELYKSLTQNLMSEFVSSHFPVFPAPPSSSTCSSTLSSQILHGLLARSNFLALHHTPIKVPETFSCKGIETYKDVQMKKFGGIPKEFFVFGG